MAGQAAGGPEPGGEAVPAEIRVTDEFVRPSGLLLGET